MSVTIKFLGGVRTVTGSSHLVATEKSEVLLDAGLFQGHRESFYRVNSLLQYNPRKINALNPKSGSFSRLAKRSI